MKTAFLLLLAAILCGCDVRPEMKWGEAGRVMTDGEGHRYLVKYNFGQTYTVDPLRE